MTDLHGLIWTIIGCTATGVATGIAIIFAIWAHAKAAQRQRQDLADKQSRDLRYMGDKIDGVGDKLGDKIDKLGDKLSDKIDKLGDKIDKLGDKIDGVGDKITSTREHLGDKIDGVGDKITSTREYLGDKLSDVRIAIEGNPQNDMPPQRQVR